MTDREGSKHQLSTSNHLRNSNALHELEDSARRSATATGANLPVPEGGEGAAGSRTSPPKTSLKAMDVRNSLPGCNEGSGYPLVDLEEVADQRLKDELDAEVDKKYKRQLANSQQELDRLDDDYEDDFEQKDEKNKADDEEMKEDTIKTDKIEQLVEEDMKKKPTKQAANDEYADVVESASQIHDQILNDLENQSIDELDVGHAGISQSANNK
jgi:recombination DNA repair RAD52 pathway protein